jgi:hypothetical protein
MVREPDTSRTLRLVALAALSATAVILAITALVLAQGSTRADRVGSTQGRPEADAAAPDGVVRRTFPAAGVTRLVLRAGGAAAATVKTGATGSAVEISGMPAGGAKGYHSPDPKWRETPAAEWGLDFVSSQRGSLLIVSTKNEMRHLHHQYVFERVTVRVPPGVDVVKEPRTLTGDGAPDLR